MAIPEGFEFVEDTGVPEGFEVIDEPEAVETSGEAFKEGAFRGFSKLGRGFAQRSFELAQSRVDSRLEDFSNKIGSGEIPATQENLEEFDRLIALSNDIRNRLESAEVIEAEQRRQFKPTSQEFPVSSMAGQITGQLVPTVAAAIGSGGGSIPASLGGRAALSGISGALTGASQATIGDESVAVNTLIGGGVGIVAPPVIEKVAAPIVRAATSPVINFFRDAIPRSKFKAGDFKSPFAARQKQAVSDVGEAFDDVSKAVEAAPAKTPEQVARAAAFEEAGITPAARSRITRNPDDFQREIQLLRQRDSDAANQLRDSHFEESSQIQNSVRELSESLGISEKAGQSIKSALDGVQTSLNASKRESYAELANVINASDQNLVDSIPIGTNQIKDAAEDAQRRFLDDATSGKVDQLLAEFGLLGTPGAKIGRFTHVDVGEATPIKVRGDVKPLNLGNLEAFRARVNDIFDPADARHKGARGLIASVIDRESDDLIKGLDGSSLPKAIIDQARKARGLAREEKLIFNQKDLVEKLTKDKPGTSTPMVEASRAMSTIKSAPIEQTQKLIKTLRRSSEGKQAVNNMGSSVVLDLLNSATAARSRQLIGPQGQNLVDFNGNQFSKAINSFGPTPKTSRALLKSILGEDAYKKMLRVEKIGEIRIPPDSAIQKGSAPDLINQFIRASKLLEKTRLPFSGKIAEIAEEGAQKREARQLLNIKPDQLDDETIDFILFNAPRIAPLFGLNRE